MDYSQFFEDYFYTQGNCTEVNVARDEDAVYLVEAKYSDEEIENYLGRGLSIVLKLDVYLADDETAICFIPSLVRLITPNLNITGDGYSNPEMACSLLEEVARTAKQFLNGIDLETENWIDID